VRNRNVWMVYRHSIVDWVAHLPDPVVRRRDAVMDWVQHVCDLGTEHAIYDVLETRGKPRYQHNDGDGGWPAFVRRHWTPRHTTAVPLFPGGGAALTEDGRVRVASTVAAFEGDEIVERPVWDLGARLAEVRSDLALPPLAVTPVRLDEVWPSDGGVSVYVSLSTDLFQPWVSGHATDGAPPDADEDLPFDNTALAQRHTPRLNAFIRGIASSVEALGGEWAFEPNPKDRTLRDVQERGIRLSA